jgi:hypothetical protein
MVTKEFITAEWTVGPAVSTDACRVASDEPTAAPRRPRTFVACVLGTDAGELQGALNGRLWSIEQAGGTVLSVAYAAAAAMASDGLVIEDRLSALVVYRRATEPGR